MWIVTTTITTIDSKRINSLASTKYKCAVRHAVSNFQAYHVQQLVSALWIQLLFDWIEFPFEGFVFNRHLLFGMEYQPICVWMIIYWNAWICVEFTGLKLYSNESLFFAQCLLWTVTIKLLLCGLCQATTFIWFISFPYSLPISQHFRALSTHKVIQENKTELIHCKFPVKDSL